MKLLLGAVLLLLALGAPSAMRESSLRMNYTDSVPIGLYNSQREPGAPYAGLCLPAETIQSAMRVGLELDHGGECADGYRPMLKPLYRATPQTPIQLDAEGFRINGRRLSNTTPKAYSKAGKPLTHYAFGSYTSGLWAISDYNRDSFDSRYFGPVAPESVRFYARPILVYQKGK